MSAILSTISFLAPFCLSYCLHANICYSDFSVNIVLDRSNLIEDRFVLDHNISMFHSFMSGKAWECTQFKGAKAYGEGHSQHHRGKSKK